MDAQVRGVDPLILVNLGGCKFLRSCKCPSKGQWTLGPGSTRMVIDSQGIRDVLVQVHDKRVY